MFHKITCALVAAAALGTAALAPTSASAGSRHGVYHGLHPYYGRVFGNGSNGNGYTWRGFCWRPNAYVCQ